MASSNRSIASSSTPPSSRVRQLWQSFERSLTSRRVANDHKISAAKTKVDSDYTKTPAHLRMSASQHEETKARIVKEIKETYFERVRAEWHSKLEKAGLKVEDWSDITEEEMEQVANVLGDGIEEESDEDMVVVGPTTPSGPLPQTFTPSFFQPIAPSISTSTRSSNVSSASSYALVDPSQFHSEDEDDYFWRPVVATSHDLTSDDDESPGLPIPIHNQNHTFSGWSSDSVASSLHNSVDSFADIPFSRPPLSSFPQNIPIVRQPTNKSTTSLSEKNKEKPEKSKIRQSYVGPHLADSDEPLSEADDFELFKMQTRMQKIVEFHQAAALAEIRLAIEIYKERKAPNGEANEVSIRVVEHQKRMAELQASKEEERKATVKAERAKRRSELRTRPGRSNTLIAPKPSVPTNPSWLTDLENSAPSQLEPKFDLSKILSDDPREQQNSVDKLLEQMFPGAYSSNSPPPPPPSNTNPFQQQHPIHHSRNSSAPAWNMSSTSLHSTASGSSSHASSSQPTRRRPSNASRQRGRPSPFGEEDFSDEEETSSPSMNPFVHPDTNALLSIQLQEDPELAAAFAQYTAIGGGSQPKPSPPVPSWATKPTIQLPAAQQIPWAQKESPGTPVASAWTRKKPVASANSQVTPTNLSFAQFGISDQNDFMTAPTPAMSFSGLGRRSVVPNFSAEQEEEDTAWEEPPPKVAPLPSSSTLSSNKAATTAPKVASASKPEQKIEKATPAPPAPVSKKQTKKQRQVNKKNALAAATASLEEPEPAASENGSAEPPADQHLALEPPSQSAEPLSFMAKMIPGMARIRKDSSPTSPFPGWDDAASTPRPAPKIPSHVQEALTTKPEGTPRPNLFKKLHMSESVSSKLANDQLSQSSTIRAPQWGSASTNAGSSRVWNIFGSESPAPKTAIQQSTSFFGDHDMRVPGGLDEIGDGNDGGGGEDNDGGGVEEEAEEEALGQAQHFWKPAASAWSLPANKATSPLAQQPVLSAASRLRRQSEAGKAPSGPGTPAAKPAPAVVQSQANSAPTNGKKGKGKKGAKGKKATVEEIPDEEGDNRGDILPVDSKVLLLPAESQVILEPKPSKPPRMFNSIISYGDDDEDDEETTSSSFAGTPSTAASSPPDPFGGDDARLAAAIKELQEGTSKMEKLFGNGARGQTNVGQPAWGRSASEAEFQESPAFPSLGQRPATQSAMQQTPVWGQLNGKDKGKGKMTDVEDWPKAPNPTIHNLKRSKATAGGKLF